MRLWTYGEARKKVQKELDLEDELFITPTEMLGYFNEAIDEAEAEIHKIHEDYFLTSDTLTLVSGTAGYDMPSDIYASKIRALMYDNGSRRYQIKRVTNLQKFAQIQEANYLPDVNQDLQFFVKNANASTGPQVVFAPPPQENGEFITLWYLRNANRVAVDSDYIDIPEFTNFVMTYVKALCRAKENGGELTPIDGTRVSQQRQMMVDTLTGMVPDDDDQVPMDLSFYGEMS